METQTYCTNASYTGLDPPTPSFYIFIFWTNFMYLFFIYTALILFPLKVLVLLHSTGSTYAASKERSACFHPPLFCFDKNSYLFLYSSKTSECMLLLNMQTHPSTPLYIKVHFLNKTFNRFYRI